MDELRQGVAAPVVPTSRRRALLLQGPQLRRPQRSPGDREAVSGEEEAQDGGRGPFRGTKLEWHGTVYAKVGRRECEEDSIFGLPTAHQINRP